MIRARKITLAGVGAGCLVLFGGCGALLGAVTDAQPAPAASRTVAASPLPTVTYTAHGKQPVVVTAPAETSTAPAPPVVTAPAPTVYVDPPEADEPAPAVGAGNDERFSTCREAIANGYGPYLEGVDTEYDWYRDADHDGEVCER